MAVTRQFKSVEISQTIAPSLDLTFSLLKAVPFIWDDQSRQFTWSDNDGISTLLKAPANMGVEDMDSPEPLLEETILSHRQRVIDDLNWIGARYETRYPIRAYDDQLIWIEERGEKTGEGIISGVMRDVTDNLDPRQESFRPQQALPNFTYDDVLLSLQKGRLTLAYQPIIDAGTGETVHYEGLMRRVDQNGQLSSAGFLIMAAERYDLVHHIDALALTIAGAALTEHKNIKLALNVSAGTVKDKIAAKAYISTLKSLGSDASRIILELTETLALDDAERANDFAAQAKALGCEFAIDDFGAGHTTFQNLLGIEADIIKIDGSFVRDISTAREKQVFVRLIVDLAQTLGIKTVAEMVDNEADATRLKELGVDMLQGYLFGYPGAII